jgi:hypothetical protein
MQFKAILKAISDQIAELEKARKLLQDGSGRQALDRFKAAQAKRKRQILSPEARQRIADAQRKRWAAAKKEKG